MSLLKATICLFCWLRRLNVGCRERRGLRVQAKNDLGCGGASLRVFLSLDEMDVRKRVGECCGVTSLSSVWCE